MGGKSDSSGQGSGGGASSAGGELSESAEAKVLGRSAVGDWKGWGGLVIASEEGELAAAKGLLGVDEDEVEKGFEAIGPDPPMENGFAEDELDEGFAPNRVSPILITGLEGNASAFDSAFMLSFFLSFATSDILIPRNARTLPSFRLHVFRLHDNTYNRLPWPGKNSGRSPLSWRRRTMRSLHTLHFASEADGGVERSSHSWARWSAAVFKTTYTCCSRCSKTGSFVAIQNLQVGRQDG